MENNLLTHSIIGGAIEFHNICHSKELKDKI